MTAAWEVTGSRFSTKERSAWTSPSILLVATRSAVRYVVGWGQSIRQLGRAVASSRLFSQDSTCFHARISPVRCPNGCGVEKIKVPWADSGFTLLFKVLAMALVREMPIMTLAELNGEHDTLLWRIVHCCVD